MSKEGGEKMEGKVKIGIMLLIAQLCLLGMTRGFCSVMDHQAQKAGIAEIINGAR